ncbi:hypothetical protein [Deinococcus multiflagellatus]|uniref:Uncharacterized protein n=1 Tax=Deinococcus multiflagellatus TaxID=1656887 RepID=A0ABW1ZGY2_9DEIO|nr:hypothetical protein [Deinococcus multiflagellatus]MBZ9713733.1 hypothetical protein [Deinococcus multiflagellatus]
MTQKHATRADIEAILKARRDAAVEVQAIPALPPQKASVKAQSEPAAPPLTQPAAVPSVTVAPTPTVSDADLETFLGKHLPALIAAGQELARPPFTWNEVITLGQGVSAAVAEGLPQVGGLEARVLVVVITRHVWRTYATPLLPAAVKPFTSLLETLIVTSIEAAYKLAVKPRK